MKQSLKGPINTSLLQNHNMKTIWKVHVCQVKKASIVKFAFVPEESQQVQPPPSDFNSMAFAHGQYSKNPPPQREHARDLQRSQKDKKKIMYTHVCH